MKQTGWFWNRSRKIGWFLMTCFKILSTHTLLSKYKEQSETKLSLFISKEWLSLTFACNSAFELQYVPPLTWSLLVMQLPNYPSASAHRTSDFYQGPALWLFRGEENSRPWPVAKGTVGSFSRPRFYFYSCSFEIHLACSFPGEDLCVHALKTFPQGHKIFVKFGQ